MIGLDTNILIRYLTQDDPKQAHLATKLIEKAVAEGNKIWISQITLCETSWVLKKCYDISKEKIRHILLKLLLTPQIQVENEEATWLALKDFETSTDVGLADCLIGRSNAAHGCEITYTFDRAAIKHLPKLYGAVL